MPYTILCVVGGVHKRRDKGLLKARERYLGPHIEFARKTAYEKSNIPCFILSSKHGLLAEGEGVEDYTHTLVGRDLGILVDRVCAQLSRMRTREVYFYTFPGEEWQLYSWAMTLAAERLGARLITTELEEPGDAF